MSRSPRCGSPANTIRNTRTPRREPRSACTVSYGFVLMPVTAFRGSSRSGSSPACENSFHRVDVRIDLDHLIRVLQDRIRILEHVSGEHADDALRFPHHA